LAPLLGRIKIKSFADWKQDATLLINIDDKDIIVNLNDDQGLGWAKKFNRKLKNLKTVSC
tara:strand:- start:1843 stop:2022 length:180 start_codon:yes stop_codon:yes gene_type:complete